MSGHLYLGIDPGNEGALAFYEPGTGDLEILDMPIFEIKSGKTMKKKLDMHGLSDVFRTREIKAALVENVGVMPGQGNVSAFNFGTMAGGIQAMVVAHQIPMDLVRPAIWKKAMGLTSDKDECRRAASLLLPKHSALWPLKKHDGRAEAALMAYYLAHELKGVAK